MNAQVADEILLFDTQFAFLSETATTACWIGGRGCGKAQPVDEPVLTPSGWVPIGSLKIGDSVIGSSGKAVKVVGVFPQGEKQVYRVKFSDGSSTRACGEHYWSVNRTGWDTGKKRGVTHVRPWRLLTTAEIMSRPGGSKPWVLPEQPVVDTGEDFTFVDPWLLGFLIGDGCFRGPQVCFSSADAEVVARVSSLFPECVRHREGCDYRISDGGELKRKLMELGLWGKKSQDKRIPSAVMLSSAASRAEFLKGLMDADGTCSSVGRPTLTTSSAGLANDVADLVRSLGGVAHLRCKQNCGYRSRKTGEYVQCLRSYTVSVNTPSVPFWLSRKASRWKLATKYRRHKTIKEIVPDGVAQCVCISVAAVDGLYLTRDYTLTHNTFTLALWTVKQCMDYPGVRGVIASSTNPQLKQATIPDFLHVFDLLGLEYEYSEWRGVVEFSNGSSFKFQSLDVPEEQIKGGNIGFFGVDEVDACLEGHIKKLGMAVRAEVGSLQRRFVGNSPPPKHWTFRWFVEKDAREAKQKVRGPLYQASMFENYLLPKTFVEAALLDNPEGSIEYRRWILGEMGVPLEGLVYTEFDKRHIIPASGVPWNRVVGYINALDLGANHYTVFMRAAVTDDDKVYVFAEYAGRRTELAVHANRIKELLALDPADLEHKRPYEDNVGAVWCDHDLQDRLELAVLGIDTIPAIKGEKDAGISAVKKRLNRNTLFFVDGACPKLMEELPYYIWHPKTDDTVRENDDACDCLRYLVGGFDLESPEIHL